VIQGIQGIQGYRGYTGYTGYRGYREYRGYSGYSRLKGLGVDINGAGDTETGIQGDNGIQRNTGGCKQRRIQSKTWDTGDFNRIQGYDTVYKYSNAKTVGHACPSIVI